MQVLVYIYRVILMYLLTWITIRILGKKSITQLTTNDLAGILLLTTIAAEPLVNKISSKAGLGIIIISGLTILISKLSLNKYFYNVEMKASIIIVNGQIIKDELKKNHMNLHTLMSELRLKGYPNISKIAYAIIEPNGQVSVIPKQQHKNVTTGDLQLKITNDDFTLPLIIDGEIQTKNLQFINLDTTWLERQLKKRDVMSEKEVFLALIDLDHNLYLHIYKAKNYIKKPPVI